MDTILLESKLHIPTPLPGSVPRPRLQTSLEDQVAHHKLILISAPAGYGKTTLLAEWARATSLPVAWLSVSEEEDGVERFLRYLLAAWETVRPDIVDTPLGILLGSQMPDIKAVLSAFINAANQVRDDAVFVLDDYHLVEDAAVHEAMTFLVDHLPPRLHFILAGRSDPPLPLARYRARRQLLEIRAGELQFTREESAAFLTQSMGLDLSPGEIASLHTQTEGWIAGLQLTALRLQRSDRRGEGTPAVSGRQRFIADYLSEDVLALLPDDVRRFLLQTSVLDRLCGSLCNAITGRQDGQELLELLERENLFLVPLDDRREWFRYHALFAGFLQGELNQRYPGEVAALHARAARWHLDHDLPEQAFRHALAGGDAGLAEDVARRYIPARLMAGEIRIVKRWLESLPQAWYASYPELGLYQAAFLFFTGALDAAVHRVDEVEQKLVRLEGEPARGQLARATAVRCFIACFQNDLVQAEFFAEQALRDLLEEDDLSFRPGVYGALGDTYRRNGRWRAAKECYLKVLAFPGAPTFRVEEVHLFGALADLDLRQGHLRQAAAYWRRALAAIQEQQSWGTFPLPVIGWVYIRMGEILYEWNELGEVAGYLDRGLERVELGGDVRAMVAGHLIAGRLKLAEGDIEAAGEYLERARPLLEQAPFPDWTPRFERFQLEFWLAQGRLRAAADWAGERLSSGALEEQPESEAAQLAVARVLIVKGDGLSLQQARALLMRLPAAAEAEGRTGILIEALALQALAHWKQGDRAAAMTSVEHALRLAEPEGYVRLFADLGLPMARLLQEARSRAVFADYVEKLLMAFGADRSTPTPLHKPLPQPLTAREREVLELIAAGLTNSEIAEKLVISPETVKKHLGNLYGKLEVGNRTEAVARARALDLFN